MECINLWKNDKLLDGGRGDDLGSDSTIFIMKLILPYLYFIIMFDGTKIQRKFDICKKNLKKVSSIKNY